jgi:hypothetical protein
MTSLPIVWQRLVSSDGKTCDRCNATHQEMQRAVRKLREALRPLSIEPNLEIRQIDEKSFEANPEKLLLRAALIASSELLDLTPEARLR